MVIVPSDTHASLRLWWLPLLQHPRLQKPHRSVRCAEHLWPRRQERGWFPGVWQGHHQPHSTESLSLLHRKHRGDTFFGWMSTTWAFTTCATQQERRTKRVQTENNCKIWIGITQPSGALGTLWTFIKLFRGLTSSRAGKTQMSCERQWAISLWQKQAGAKIPADSKNWNPTALVNYLKHISNLSFDVEVLFPLQ